MNDIEYGAAKRNLSSAYGRCANYCGVTCINGGCPIANRDEYIERGYDVVWECKDCPYYKGCEDCYFNGNEEFKYVCDENRRS